MGRTGWPNPPVQIVTLQRATLGRYQKVPGSGILRADRAQGENGSRIRMLCHPTMAALDWLRTEAPASTTMRPERARDRTRALRNQAAEAAQRCRDSGIDQTAVTISVHWLDEGEEREALRADINQTLESQGLQPNEWITLTGARYDSVEVNVSRKQIRELIERPEETWANHPGIEDIRLTEYITLA